MKRNDVSSRFDVLSNFQINNFLTDIEIKLSDGSINAHKVILSASSEFFQKLFHNSCCKEASTGIVKLPTVHFHVMEYIVDYVYMRKSVLIDSESLSFCIDIVTAADYLRMMSLLTDMDEAIAAKFAICDIIVEIDRIMMLELKQVLAIALRDIAISIAEGKLDYLIQSLSCQTLLNILHRSDFSVNENDLVVFLISFMKSHSSNSSSILQEIIDEVRLELLNDTHLRLFFSLLRDLKLEWRNKTDKSNFDEVVSSLSSNTMRNFNLFRYTDTGVKEQRFLRCIPHLIIASRYKFRHHSPGMVSNGINLIPLNHRSNSFTKIDFVWNPDHSWLFFTNWHHLVVLTREHSVGKDLGFVYDLISLRKITIPDIDTSVSLMNCSCKFSGYSSVLLDNELYVFGGVYSSFDSMTTSSNILKFNLIERKWLSIQSVSLKCPCWNMGAVVDRKNNSNVIYISGGRNESRYLKSFYAIDLTNNVLIDYPNLPVTVSGHKMDFTNSFVVIFGGEHNGSISFDILLFDFTASLWRKISTSIADCCICRSICFDNASITTDDDCSTVKFFQLVENFSDCQFSIYSQRVRLKEYSSSEHNNNNLQLITKLDGLEAFDITYGLSVSHPIEPVNRNCE